ncbi:MAG: protein-disulfide reductase DsbD [Gammaproteobacteria bacterium]
MPGRFLTFLILLLAAPALFAFDDDFLMPDEAFKPTVTADGNTIKASWEVAEGYYLYKEKFRFESQSPDITLGEPEFPPAEMHHGIKPNGEEGEVEVYFNEVTVSIPVTSGSGAADILVRYQGCAEKGLCYPPQKKTYTLELASAPAAVSGAPEAPALGSSKPGGLQSLSGDLGLGFQDDILPADQAMQFEAIVLDGRKLQAIWSVADDVYMYADKITLVLEGDAALGEYSLPDPEIKWGLKPDGTEGNIPVYHGTVRAEIPLKRPVAGEVAVSLRAGYQGCAEQGVCYPPQKKVIELLLPAVALADAAEPAAREDAPAALEADAPAAEPVAVSEEDGLFENKGFWAIVAAFFIIGVGLSLTPCVFPMIPILSGIITGQGKDLTPAKGFVLSLVYVLAMAVTYTIAGVFAALSGENLQVALQNPWVLTAFALLFVALALSMFGFYELQLPSSLQSKLNEISNKQKQGSLIGVAIMGFLSALIVGPCVAPPLAAALAYIGTTGDAVLGASALFVMSLGMGMPLLLIGVSAGKLLPRAGGWMETVKAVFGVIMLAVAVTMLERLVPTYLPGFATMLMWALLLIIPAIYMGALEPLPEGVSGWRKLWKGLGVAFLVYGGIVLIGAGAGNNDPLSPLEGIGVSTTGTQAAARNDFTKVKTVEELDAEMAKARSASQRVLLDFYADWCVYCKTMEKKVFPHPDVQSRIADMALIKADVTADDALLKHFNLVAPPTVILFDEQGVERDRIIGDVTVEQLVDSLDKAF